MMLVHLIPTPPQGAESPGQTRSPVPLLMQYDHPTGWRLLNLFSEQIPDPGQPPHLTSPYTAPRSRQTLEIDHR